MRINIIKVIIKHVCKPFKLDSSRKEIPENRGFDFVQIVSEAFVQKCFKKETFSCESVKFLRTPFFIEYLGWLLLQFVIRNSFVVYMGDNFFCFFYNSFTSVCLFSLRNFFNSHVLFFRNSFLSFGLKIIGFLSF